jgi:uncharacterized alkaline shock family protein YloU
MTQAIAGTLKVSNDCIADLAGYAALECYGVVGMALSDSENGVTRLLPFNVLRKGINVSVESGHVVVDVHVILEQGVNMASVSSNLVSSVRFILSKIAELDDVEVRVHVEGMRTR